MKNKHFISLIAAFVAAILVSTQTGCNKEKQPETGGVITSISLTESSISLSKGGTYQLTAAYFPSNPDNATLLWASSNEDVAKVTNGIVEAVSDGKATISVTPMTAWKSGNLSLVATCEVTVETVLIRELSFSSDTYKAALTRGTFQLDPQVVPAAAKKPGSLYYEVVSGGQYISVDPSTGLVTLKAIGTGTIKVSTKDGSELSKTLTFVVQEEDVWPTDFSFDYQQDMVVGTKQRVRLVYEPTTANRKEITIVASGGLDWVKVTKISDEEIELEACQVTDGGTWSDTGIQILVTIKTGENSYTTGSEKRYVWVHAGEPSLSIDENQPTPWGKLSDGMVVGETHDLQVDVQNLHKDLYAERVPLIYEVNNPDVLSIDENGRMAALAKGASRLWVYTPDRKICKELFVEVFGKPALIEPSYEYLFVRFGGSASASYHVKDAEGKQTRQAVSVTNINSSFSGMMTSTVENYFDQSRYAKVTFQSTRSSAEKTIKGTATVCPLGYPSVTKTIDVYDAMYDADDIKPFDGIKFYNGKLTFVDGGYRGSGYFNDGTMVAPDPSAYSFKDCRALVVWTGQRSSLNLGESKLGGLSGQGRSDRPKVNGYAIAWKDAYTAIPDASDQKAFWQRTYTTVDGHETYYNSAPIWGGGTWLHTGNTYQYGYEITQAEMYYNSLRGDDYDIWPVRHLSNYTATPPESPVTSGWYVPTSSEWYMMLRCQGDAVSMNSVAKNLSKFLSVMTDGQGLVDTNGNSLYHYWSCQEGAVAESKAVYMTGFFATPAGTSPEKSKDKKRAACTRGFLAF